LAVGKCASSAGLMVTEGIGWKPSSLAGRAGEPVQKYTKSCLSRCVIFSTMDQSHRLNLTKRSLFSPDSSLNDVYEINTATFMSPTPFSNRRRSSAVRLSSEPSGRTSRTPVRMLCNNTIPPVIPLHSPALYSRLSPSLEL
jgi:hypothetical protein